MNCRIASIVLGCSLVAFGPTLAETRRYALEIPAGETVRYELDLEPLHTGVLTVLAEWSGNRQLSIRLEPPFGAGLTMRRNGPSPQRVEINVNRQALAVRGPWRLIVRSPAGRAPAEGVLQVVLPEPAPRKPTFTPHANPTPADPWAAWRLPDDSLRTWTYFDDWAHRLRDVLRPAGHPDACRWQQPLLDYIERTRRALIEEGAVPSATTRSALRIIAAVIDDIEVLRTSEDPFIAGPFPDDPRRRAAYLRVRSKQLLPLEAKLDRVLLRIGRDHAPDLAVERWPVRFVSCLMACERHFAEAPLVGAENATNFELAENQWNRLVEAANVLFALADVEPAP